MDSYEHERTDDTAKFWIGGREIDKNQFKFENSGSHCEKIRPLKTELMEPFSVLPPESPFSLRYGQMIALAGDYFKNFQDMNYASPGSIKAIIDRDVYKKDCFSFGWLAEFPNIGINYLKLAINNPEHFRGPPQVKGRKYVPPDPTDDDSVVAYKDGHGRALAFAAAQRNDNDQYLSYAINAFYDHFLTDMFASGHLRQPRRYLHSNHGTTDWIASKAMHDEDNKEGLWVRNEMGKVWKAFGDGYELAVNYTGGNVVTKNGNAIPRLLNKDNWQQVLNAVDASVEEVKQVIRDKKTVPKPESFQALKIKPNVFPPGAYIFKDSKIDDYNISMTPYTPIPTRTDLLFYRDSPPTRGPPADNPYLLAPPHLWERSGIPTHMKLQMDNRNKFFLNQQVWELNTTPKESTAGIQLGKQSYPIYIIADYNGKSRLFVRLNDIQSDKGELEDRTTNLYTTAHYDPSEPARFDSNSNIVTPLKPRMEGRRQGDDLPSNIVYPPTLTECK